VGLMPPGLRNLVVAAAGALALSVGVVATVNGALIGVVLALGGVLLLAWSVWTLRPRA
jgi:hypothetical protein